MRPWLRVLSEARSRVANPDHAYAEPDRTGAFLYAATYLHAATQSIRITSHHITSPVPSWPELSRDHQDHPFTQTAGLAPFKADPQLLLRKWVVFQVSGTCCVAQEGRWLWFARAHRLRLSLSPRPAVLGRCPAGHARRNSARGAGRQGAA